MCTAYARTRWAQGTVRGWRPAMPQVKDALMALVVPAVGHVVFDVPFYVTWIGIIGSFVALDMAVYRLTHPRDPHARIAAEVSAGGESADAPADGSTEVSPGGR
ncbi:MAG: hypothetical protein ACRC0L_10975 [Angustibacter sp.]